MNPSEQATAEARGSWADWLEGLRRWRAANLAASRAVLAIFWMPMVLLTIVNRVLPPLGIHYRQIAAIIATTTAAVVLWIAIRHFVHAWRAAKSMARADPGSDADGLFRGAGLLTAGAGAMFATGSVVLAIGASNILPRWVPDSAMALGAGTLLAAAFAHGLGQIRMVGGLESANRQTGTAGASTRSDTLRGVRRIQAWAAATTALAWLVVSSTGRDVEAPAALTAMSAICLVLCGLSVVVSFLVGNFMTRRYIEAELARAEGTGSPSQPSPIAYRVGGEGAKPAEGEGGR